jgi:hypothetical protein
MAFRQQVRRAGARKVKARGPKRTSPRSGWAIPADEAIPRRLGTALIIGRQGCRALLACLSGRSRVRHVLTALTVAATRVRLTPVLPPGRRS